jgi:hypothetical protein
MKKKRLGGDMSDFKYNITIDTLVNGSISPSKTSANYRDKIDLTINPSSNYKLDNGTLTDADNATIKSEFALDASGNIGLKSSNDYTIKIDNNFETTSKTTKLKSSDSIDLDADKISIGGTKHPAPLFDAFCNSLADLFSDLIITINAGTVGTAAKQQFVEIVKITTSLNNMIVNLKLAAKAQGDFASKKVTNG